MTKKLVVVGNGMAAGRAIERLIEAEPGAYDITIFNAEPRVNYDRIMLSPVLSGEKAYEDILIHDDAWYEINKVNLIKNCKVTEIDRNAKTVTGADGTVADYDKLLIATGSYPFIIPVPGHDLDGVLAYRDLDDVENMIKAAKKPGSRAVVIGGGLLGLEAAYGLKMQGMEVTVLHLMPTLMERQLDEAAGYLLEKAITQRGINIITRANTKAILGVDSVQSVQLDDGRIIPADIVVMAVGIKPNMHLADDAGLETGRGVLVNDNMVTSDPDILSVGECVEHRGQCYGLVAPLYEMANVVADQLSGDEASAYTGSVTSTKLKVTGIDLFSAGDFAEGEGREDIDGAWFFDMLKRGTDVSEMRETLIFGQAYQGGEPLDPMAAVAALPADAEICGCNGVCKSTITGAITDMGLASVDDVRGATKASASCGSCTGLVEQLLAFTLGDEYDAEAVKPMCGCTDLGHGDVRRLIKAKKLQSLPAVMQELGWKTSCGCAKCRPALNYYLLSDWPGIYVDDKQSRFVNERVHANIQKDGTYSVVPRMWGGMTTSKELRAIADVVDKFDIPTVKCTGGARIDMLGVKKEDLPAVWSDLNAAGLVSGHAYGKALRTVKTCVGTDWCRFGTQDSTGLGVKIEKFMWGSWTPHKLKLAVSGCPRNCAEATCKDIGVVCTETGYDIHYAGAAGMEVRATDLLCHVETEDEAIEYIAALTQLYREQAWSLERVHKWMKRVGQDTIREQILEDHANRKTLFERFAYSQKFSQIDPWDERANGRDAHEFAAMAEIDMERVA